MRVKTVRRRARLPIDDVRRRIANQLTEPRMFAGGLGAYHGRVTGDTFWFRTNAGRKMDGTLTVHGRLSSEGTDTLIAATVDTVRWAPIVGVAGAAFILATILHLSLSIVGWLGLLFFVAAFSAILDVATHWRYPCDLLIAHLDGCLGANIVPEQE